MARQGYGLEKLDARANPPRVTDKGATSKRGFPGEGGLVICDWGKRRLVTYSVDDSLTNLYRY